MANLTFTPEHAKMIIAGTKTSTIRASSAGIYPGCVLHLYTGLRTKACKKIGSSLCRSIDPVFVDETGIFWLEPYASTKYNIKNVGDEYVYRTEGYKNAETFLEAWFRLHPDSKKHPFYGWLIDWDLFKQMEEKDE